MGRGRRGGEANPGVVSRWPAMVSGKGLGYPAKGEEEEERGRR